MADDIYLECNRNTLFSFLLLVVSCLIMFDFLFASSVSEVSIRIFDSKFNL